MSKSQSPFLKPFCVQPVLCAGIVALASLLMTTPAWAQSGGTLMPPGPGGPQPAQPAQTQDITAAPQPKLPKDYPVWVGYLVVFLMVAAIMGASLMPSKRSHQD